ncbi:hypothetical protein BH20GEM1_BH20GEM1_00890 [soil metagenome]
MIRTSTLDRIIGRCQEQVEPKEKLVPAVMVGGPGHRGRAIMFLFFESSFAPDFVVKVAFSPEESRFLGHEYSALQNVRPILSHTSATRVPEPVTLFRVEESTALMCKALIGQRLLIPQLTSTRGAMGRRVLREYFKQAFRFSIDLANAGSNPASSASSLPQIVARFRHRFGDQGEAGKELAAFEHAVANARIPSTPTWQHCDMMMSNVLTNRQELRILDWEHSRANSQSWFDVAYAPVALALMASWQTGAAFPMVMMQVLNRESWPGRIISEEMERVWEFPLPLSWGVLLTAMETALRQENEGRLASSEWSGFVHTILGKRGKQELSWLSRW